MDFNARYFLNSQGQLRGTLPIPFGVDPASLRIVTTEGGAAIEYSVMPPTAGFVPVTSPMQAMMMPFAPACYATSLLMTPNPTYSMSVIANPSPMAELPFSVITPN